MKNQILKKGLALFLTAALTVGLIPTLPDNIETIKAEETEQVTKGPGVLQFATKKELMDVQGKLFFGKNVSDEAQRWYILAPEGTVETDNVVLMATEPLIEEQVFSSDPTKDKMYDKGWACTYDAEEPETVCPSHYGASELRKKLNEIAEDKKYFTKTEQGLMNEVTVVSTDQSGTYKTKDKLYVPILDERFGYFFAGADDIFFDPGDDVVNIPELGMKENCWLRTPSCSEDMREAVYITENSGGYIHYSSAKVNEEHVVQPILNLDLQSVLFASVVPQASADDYGYVSDTGYPEKSESGEIIDKPAMTLRLSGAGTPVGSAIYNENSIFAKKADGAENAALVVQGENWFYSRVLDGETQITAKEIGEKVRKSENSFDDCKIWVETIKDGVSYANMAIKGQSVDKVFVTGITPPVGGVLFDKQAACATEGVITTSPTVSYTTVDGKTVTEEKAGWLTDYIASVTISPDMQNGKVFSDDIIISINGNEAIKTEHPDGSITASYTFTSGTKKITKIAAPSLPTNNAFANYYTKDNVLTTKELGAVATVTFEDNTNTSMPVKWTLIGEGYNEAPGAENQFQWSIDSTQYDGKYDLNNCSPTGIVTISNKSTTAVTVTGTDAAVKYTSETIDISKYFTIGENAGAPNYTLVNGEGAGTGEGTLAGTLLTVTRTGTFVIRLTTAANGVYGTATATSTLTVGEGVFENDAKDYSGAYDGQPHGITVTVAQAGDAVITYSTDGTTYNTTNPQFTDRGTYIVYYKIEKPNHTTVSGNRTVTIHAEDITITAADQELVWGTDIDKGKYTVTEGALVTGEQISRVTLTSSTAEFTDNGIVAVNDAKIVNADGKDVTANYNVSYVNGKLVIKHNTILAPTELTVAKTTTAYTAGASLNVDDLTVKATYPDGYTETVTDYKTNADTLDMTTAGDKTLTVTFTRNGKTLTRDISIIVSQTPVVPAPVVKYKATVNNGTGDGEYEVGQTITITADATPVGKQFKVWTVVSGSVTFADSTSTATTFKMPANTVEVTAVYEDKVVSVNPPNVDPPTVNPPTVEPPTVNPPVKEVGRFTDAKSNGTYKVTGAETVEYVKLSNGAVKTATIPASVTANGKTYLVTSVAAGAFKNNKIITKVTMGSNIERIGANAFSGCKKLKDVTFGRNALTIGNKAFYKCIALTSIVIPPKVTKLGEQAFYGCKKLKKIRIRTDKLTVKTVGNKAFKGIYSNARITVPKGKVKEYGTLLKKKM